MESSRDYILHKLVKAQENKKIPPEPDFQSHIFPDPEEPPLVAFRKNFEAVSGVFYSFRDEALLYDSLNELIIKMNWQEPVCCEPEIREKLTKYGIAWAEKTDFKRGIDAAITSCDFLVAQTGSILVTSAREGGRRMFAFPDHHIVIADRHQLVRSLTDAYRNLMEKYASDLPSQVTLITGPSRTADIEKTLVLGAHGPKGIYLFFLE